MSATRKDASAEAAARSDRALTAVKKTVPIAKQAGVATRQSAQNVVNWAKPRANAARSWAAPRIERSGVAVTDRIAPKVSAALVTAARKVDTAPPQRRRRWPRMLAGFATAVAAAAASAAAAMALRRNSVVTAGEPSGSEAEAADGTDTAQDSA